jgi:hypothetical protein
MDLEPSGTPKGSSETSAIFTVGSLTERTSWKVFYTWMLLGSTLAYQAKEIQKVLWNLFLPTV